MTVVVMEIPPALSELQRRALDETRKFSTEQVFTVLDILLEHPTMPGDLEAQVQTERGRLELAKWLSRRPYFRTYRSYAVMSAGVVFTVNYPPGG